MTYLETGVFRLKTLSPIHIQAGALSRYGQGAIRLNEKDGFLYVIDTAKLQSEIFKHGKLEAVETYTNVFSNPDSKTNITTVLENIGYDYRTNIKKISKGIVPLPDGNRFMQSGLGEHFVPGSSIKGAIKTAVLYDIVMKRIGTDTNYLKDLVNNQITRYLEIPKKQDRDRKGFKRTFAKKLLSDAFLSKHPKEHRENRGRKKERPGPFTDIFKAIKVKDAIIESADPTRFARVIKLSTPDRNGATMETLAGDEIYFPYKNMPKNCTPSQWVHIDTYAEENGEQIIETCTKVDKPPSYSSIQFENIIFTTLSGNKVEAKDVGENTRFECFYGETTIEISIDHKILESFTRAGAKLPFSDLKSLMQLCQNFAQAQWEAEQQFLNDYKSGGSINLNEIKTFYADNDNKTSTTLRVGWGTGLLGTTVTLLLDEATRITLRNDVISFDGINRTQIAPKSRRFVSKNEQPVYPLGWIGLEEN